MSKRKLLYIVFASYILFIFLPITVVMYFPQLLPSKFSYLNTMFKTSKEDSISYVDTSIVKEQTLPGNDNFYDSTSTNEGREMQNFIPGSFDSCSTDACSSISILETAEDSSLIQKTYLVTDSTMVFCVNRFVDGNDTSDTFLDFSNPLDSIYKKLTDQRLIALQEYKKDSPIQYDYMDDKLTWISIYLENCNDFK